MGMKNILNYNRRNNFHKTFSLDLIDKWINNNTNEKCDDIDKIVV